MSDKRAPNDNRADVKNPNNPAHKHDQDNRADQRNPNNPNHQLPRPVQPVQPERPEPKTK